ncbi:hypothetical protein BGZ60DRAFT_497164 [Tricladium varicosporioides]|nr:hypothetical protein BGZ60DRAFT_497164 [Hymenoscyphus varicosporioides]
MGSISTSPDYGRRPLPNLIDYIAETDPKRLYAIVAAQSSPLQSLIHITFQDFANAINCMAAWLEDEFGKSDTFETLAYMGPNDPAYFIIVIAAAKIGYKANNLAHKKQQTLLPSPRNSLDGQLNLFITTKCKILLSVANHAISDEFLAKSGLPRVNIPTLFEILDRGKPKRKYTITRPVDEILTDPFVILHTSGSTGLPKPIVLKYGWFCSIDNINNMPLSDGQPNLFTLFSGKKILNSLPAFHAAGLLTAMAFGAYFENTTYIWGPSERPMSSVLVSEMLDISPIDSLFLPPSTLEELIESPTSFEKIKKMKICAFAGGPLSKQAGDKLTPFTTILNALGSTEVACMPISAKSSPQDWEYFHYSPSLLGIEFRPIHSPPTPTTPYEQVIVRHPSTDIYHGTWFTFPEKKEYGVSDLYLRHPDPKKPNLWLYIGRSDDVLVLSNGEKVNPTSMESTVRHDHDVSAALVVGQGYFAPALIVELTPDAVASLERREGSERKLESTRLLDSIWPSVAEANASAPQHAQIAEDMIFFTSKNKPFPRTPKGTVIRRQGTELYAKEIEEFYARSEDRLPDDTFEINLYDKPSIVRGKLQDLVQKVMGGVKIELDVDFFAQGMDSLHVVRLAKQLRACATPIPEGTSITTSDIYSNPNILQLMSALKQISAATGTPTNEPNEVQRNGRGAHHKYREIPMHETLRKYVAQLSTPAKQSSPRLTVILTGSTGSLGSYLLSNLVFYPEIRKVYCLNRRLDARAVQDEVNRERGITSNFDPSVVEFLHADLSKPLLGLEENVYNKLLNEVGVVIHNAYPVSFALTLASFEPQIQGTLNLINFCASSTLSLSQKPRLFFTSSIGTLGNWSSCHPFHPDTPVPETALHDPRIPLEQGYSESKWICERLIEEAGTRSGVKGVVLRVGQIAGPVLRPGPEGMWNKKEWLPSLIASSFHLGAIPHLQGFQAQVSWIPVDELAHIIIELIVNVNKKDTKYLENQNNGKRSNTEYFHLQNPNLANWDDLIPAIKAYYTSSYPSTDPCHCKPKKKLEIVSWSEWIKRLEGSSSKDSIAVDLEKNPALHLLDFFQKMGSVESANMDTKRARECSETMRELKAIDGEWMKKWLEQWNF